MQKKWGLNIQWDVRLSLEAEQDLWRAQPGRFPRQFPPYPFLSLFLLFTARRTLVFVLLLLLFWAFSFLLETGSCCAARDDLNDPLASASVCWVDGLCCQVRLSGGYCKEVFSISPTQRGAVMLTGQKILLFTLVILNMSVETLLGSNNPFTEAHIRYPT